MTDHCFTYGSLMCEDIMGAVCATAPLMPTPARLEGFRRPHIAVISYRGREHSALAPVTRLGPYALRAPTGHYDLLGNPILSEGDILIDSVHRFKGRAAPCVILTEIYFDTLDDKAVRRLFVGATRATLKLMLVLSARAEATLRERLADPA